MLPANSKQSVGTITKFLPVYGNNSIYKDGSQLSINTFLQCITAMNENGSKCIEEFNDYLRYNPNTYGIIYVFNKITFNLEPSKSCYYEKNTYKCTYLFKKESFDFKSICIECQENNNMYNTISCLKCIHDTCQYCKELYIDCLCSE